MSVVDAQRYVVLRYDEDQCETIAEAVEVTLDDAVTTARRLAAEYAARTVRVVLTDDSDPGQRTWLAYHGSYVDEPRDDERHREYSIQRVEARTGLRHVVEALRAERKRIARDEPGGNLHLCDHLSHVIEQVEMVQAVADIVERGVPTGTESLGMAIWDLF